LTFRNRRYIFFIQTDKAIYRGGDTVRYRVFSVDSETRSYSKAPAALKIYDTNSIVMYNFANVTFAYGKYEGSFKLSDVATLGQWRLVVETPEQEINDVSKRKKRTLI
jgi:CD109 antigen